MWPEASAGVVLVVDDAPDTLRVLIEALEANGLTTLVARDGEAALRLLNRIRPDAILLDAVMPGIDGFNLCRRIKARTELAVTPVLFMTGLGGSEHVVEGLRVGGVDYLVKPINPDELVARLAIHLANARLVRDAEAALDAAGAAVATFSADGRRLWTSPGARALIEEAFGPCGARAPETQQALEAFVTASAGQALGETAPLSIPLAGERELTVTLIGRTGAGDVLARLALGSPKAAAQALESAFGLSTREAEVLEWIARGKSNRDIATILGLSPRTVTKHVEQIFLKLGVENRTAAAVTALRTLG